MPQSNREVRQKLDRLIFVDETAREWVQDVWDMSPTLGETAARFSEVFDALIDGSSSEQLESLLKTLYQNQDQT
ncbi:MAG: hypothetical protein ACFCU8_14505 [Thermosynechococcaceae cyanobacterium]